ncbi:protein kinase, putative [Leishmania donovani]|uniref:Protein kinase, putative n=1 Tax=Leishmania donovani TaxID=5661 RepID=E9B9F9_LEIDO|nr:protein kinase, putative [Leishmania donovani]CBZ31898.1 protein kinase, putative [Leishmania donovani]
MRAAAHHHHLPPLLCASTFHITRIRSPAAQHTPLRNAVRRGTRTNSTAAAVNVSAYSFAAPPLTNPYAYAASPSPSSAPSMRTVGVAAAAAAMSTVHAASVTNSGAAAHTWTNGGRGGHGAAHALTNSGRDVSLVLLTVACTLLVVTIVLLIVGVRLLKRFAAAVAAAEGARGQDILSNNLSAGEAAAYISVGIVDDDDEAALHTDNGDSRTQLVEYADEREPLLHHVRGRGGGAGRHRRSASRQHQQPGRRTTLAVFEALSILLGVSSTPPTADASSHGAAAAPRRRSRSCQAGSSAVPTPENQPALRSSPQQQRHAGRRAVPDALAADENSRGAFRSGPQLTWHSNGSLSRSGAARKCDEAAVAPASASPAPASHPAAAPGSSAAPATADHGATPPSGNAQLPVFTTTTEKDMVVYNTTHNSRYRLLQRIGIGAFSSVYLVQHKTTGKQYALKYILCKGDRERLAALRECEVIYSLQGHPQVIRIVDMFMSYQFQRASPSPTVAGSPTAAATNSACKEQASGQQGLRSFPGVPPSAPAAPAAALAPSAIATPALAPASAAPASTYTTSVAGRLKGLNDAALTKAAMESSTESRAAAHSEADDGHVDFSCVDRDRYSEGRWRGSRPRVRPSVEGVACGACMVNVDHASDVENEESAYSEHQQPQQPGKLSMRASSVCCPRPLPHSVQHTSQSSSSVHPTLSAAASASTAPATASSSSALAGSSYVPAQLCAAAGGGAQGCGHVPSQSAHHSSTTASAARAAATGSLSPPRDEAHADQPHLCCHAIDVPDAVVHDESDATAPVHASARCCAAHSTTTTATSMHPCFPSTARNATVSRSSEAGHEPGTLEDCDGGDGVHSGSDSRRRAEQGQSATRERAKPALQSRRASSEDRGSDGADDGHADIEAGREERRTELRGDADADEMHSCKGSDARSGATSSSGADEEPIQPIHRIFVPPPYMYPPLNGMAAAPRSCSICSNNSVSYAGTGNGAASVLRPQSRTCATGGESPTSHHLYSAFPTAAAGGALAVVGPETANGSTAPAPVRRIPERPDVGSLSATASPPPFAAASASLTSSSPSPSAAVNLRHTAGSLVSTSTLPHQQQQQHPQPIPSSVTSYAPARAAVSSADVKSAATGAPAVQAPIRYKDFVLSPTTVTAHAAASWTPVPATQANALVDGQTHRQPVDRGGSPAPPPCAASARVGSGAAGAGATGLTVARPTDECVNPYLERARGREPVPPPRTSYAPGGGVRYNSLTVPYVAAPTTLQAAAKGFPAQSSSPSSSLTLSASGTGVSAFDERKAGAGQGRRFEVTGADSSSQDSDASMPASQAARLTASRSLPSTAPAAATVVRNTYAPLRYGNVVQSNAASPATSSMASSSLMPPPSPSLQKQLPQPPSAACPAAAAPTVGSGRLSVCGVLRTARAGQQGEREDWDDGKPRVSASWPAKDAGLVSTQAPPLLPLPGLANQTSGAYFLRSVGRVNGAGAVPRAATPRAPYGEGRPPAAAAAQDEAPSPTRPLYTNLGVLIAGPSMTADPATATTTHVLRTGVQPPSPRHPRSNSYAGDDADRKRQRGYSNVGLTGAAPSEVRYTNAGSPNLWNAYNAGASPASAASAAAVAALTGLSPRIGAKTPTAACAGESNINDGKSSKTTHTNSSSSHLQDVCDTGYLCLVMEHHPMGDLCRYALRAQHELEMRRHRQKQSQSQALARSSLMSVGILQPITSPATATTQSRTCTSERSSAQQPQAPTKNATERDGGGTGAEAGESTSPLSLRPLSLTHGGAAGSAAAALSLLAAAADATWTVKVAMSRTDLHPALSAGVGGRGNTSGSHTAGGTDGDERATDFDTQRAASVAVDPTSENPLTEAQLLSIAYQLASVLDHMHQQNPPIVHRDLKPENILIKGELIDYLDLPLSAVLASTNNTVHCGGKDDALGKSSVSPMTPPFTTPAAVIDAAASSLTSLPPIRITRAVVPIVLIDFGLAILQDTHGRSHCSRGGGTRPYIAPESWKGDTCTASDVWSLGCVLYALATCRLVAEDVRIMSQEAKRDGFASRMLKDIIAHKYSLAFASFVVSLLVVDPAKRPTAAQAARCFCVADGDICFDLSSPFFSNVLDL